MVNALFDTNILIDFLNEQPKAGAEFARYELKAISAITWIEVMVGAPQATEVATRSFLRGFELIELDEAVSRVAVALRRERKIKLPDAVIWASARANGLLLVTRNTKDFPGDDPGVRHPYTL
ncbi:MAG TPA: VapC toxin family PIN domain ribonuclease [Parvularcula sp.]|nr:VapC toxin family PIN domain ribonuclease [Parvularcula sp.]